MNAKVDEVLELARLLACPARLAVLRAVGEGGQSVTAVADLTGLRVTTASYHLLALLDGGLVRVRRRGRRRVYSLARRKWFVAVDDGSSVAENAHG